MSSEEIGVDEVHDRIDSFVLSIFEAIRAHELLEDPNAAALTGEKLKAVASTYKEANHAIDNMTGIKHSKADQEQRLMEQSEEILSLRKDILEKEEELISKKKKFDAVLVGALSDEALGFPQPK